MRLYRTLWQTCKLKLKTRRTKKTSLITAIKLVQLDQSKPSGTKNQVDTWHVVRNKKPNVSKDAHKTAAGFADVNIYEVLILTAM